MKGVLIARNTFRECTRDRLLAGMVGSGLVVLAVTQVLSPLALGEGRRLTVDLGLSGIGLLGLLLVLLVGTSLVAKEVERRTIYNLLARPITRPAYLVGKWAGLTAAIWAVVGVLALALSALLAARGYRSEVPAVLEAAYLTALELAVVTSLAVMFSALSTPVLSALYTLGFYLAGQWSYDLRAFASKLPPELGTILSVVADLVPNLPVFNVRTLAASGHLAGTGHVLLATAYAALYVGCVLALGAAAFEKRDFK